MTGLAMQMKFFWDCGGVYSGRLVCFCGIWIDIWEGSYSEGSELSVGVLGRLWVFG